MSTSPEKSGSDQQIPGQDASGPEKIRKNETGPISGEEKSLAAPQNIDCPKEAHDGGAELTAEPTF